LDRKKVMKITGVAIALLLGVLLVFMLPVPMATADAVVTFPDQNLEAEGWL
jgi:succinate dehydrogenase hydrophobic anchor subunit